MRFTLKNEKSPKELFIGSADDNPTGIYANHL
jgi:hypothetical protein